MTFDLLTWCEERLEGKANGDEFPARCPFCDRTGKFSVNYEKQKFRCFRDTCNQQGHAARVVAHVEGISLAEAFKRFGNFEVLKTPKLAHEKRKAFDDSQRWNIELPSEFIPCFQAGRDPEWRVIKYLRERLQNETLREFGVGFALNGDYYNRAIIPVVCPYGRAFVARDATEDWKTNKKRPKYKNATGNWASSMLFGWPYYMVGHDLLLVEGPFDVMKCFEHGIPALALLGKELLPGQRSLLFTLPRNTRVIIGVDAGESRFVTDDIASKLYSRFKVFVADKLPQIDEHKTDFGNSTKEQAYKAIDNAKLWT